MQPLAQLPQPRPSSSGSPSSRNRSVQRLRAAVADLRQGWAANNDDNNHMSPAMSQAAAHGATTHISQPRPMIVRVPPAQRSRSRGGGGGTGVDPSAAADGGGGGLLLPPPGQLSPVPHSPYQLYTGDPSPSTVAAMMRGARIVRAHGLRDNEDPMTTAQFFGVYTPSKSNQQPQHVGSPSSPSPTTAAASPSGGGRALRESSSGTMDGSQGGAREGGGGKEDESTARSGISTIDTERLGRQTEDELAARTNALMSGDIRPLLSPKSIFFVPALLSSGPTVAQIADEFTAGNTRRKMLGVIQREAMNHAALKALSRAQGAVRECERIAEKEKEELSRHRQAALDETLAGGAAAADASAVIADPAAASGSGGPPGGGRRKEKDSETIAREQAIQAEAARVKGACELLRSAQPSEGTNHAVLFARLRRILSVRTDAARGGSSDRFCIQSRRLLQLLFDSLNVSYGGPAAHHLLPTPPQWEVLAHTELQLAEAARIARETKSYRRGTAAAAASASQQNNSIVASPSAAVVVRPLSSPAAGSVATIVDTAEKQLGDEPSASGLKSDESSSAAADAQSNASFQMPAALSPNFSFSPSAATASGEYNSHNNNNPARRLGLRYPPVHEFCRNPQTGALLRSLAEEFVAAVLDPQTLTVGRVLADTGFSDGRSLAAIASASPSGDLSACWQPPLRVEEVSRLVVGLVRCLTSTEQNRKVTLVETVITAVFNFARTVVDCRDSWTAVCNSIEDMTAKCAARNAALAEDQRKRKNSPTRHGANGSTLLSSPQKGAGRSPPHGNSPASTPFRGAPTPTAAAAAAAAATPKSPVSNSAASAETNGSRTFDDHNNDDEDAREYDEDGRLVGLPEVPLPSQHHQPGVGGGVPRQALLTARPSDMDRDFYEMEYIGFEPFSELQRCVMERRHFAGAPDTDAEQQSFGLLRAVCSSLSAAFRMLLQEQQLAAAMAGSKRKKKIDISDLPPVYPTKQLVLRFKDFRNLFLSSERVAGPLLPFVLATVTDTLQGGASRWRVPAPLSAYM